MCLRLRTLLKTAKKKLRDQDTGGAEFGSPMSSLRVDQGRHSQADGAFGRMKEKVWLSDTELGFQYKSPNIQLLIVKFDIPLSPFRSSVIPQLLDHGLKHSLRLSCSY